MIPAAKLPTPPLLEVNCTVRQPLRLYRVAELIKPWSAVPVYSPRKVAAVLFPSQILIRSSGLGNCWLRSKTIQFKEMASPGMSGQMVIVKFSLFPYEPVGPPVSSNTPEHVEMSPPDMLNCCACTKVPAQARKQRLKRVRKGKVRTFRMGAGTGVDRVARYVGATDRCCLEQGRKLRPEGGPVPGKRFVVGSSGGCLINPVPGLLP